MTLEGFFTSTELKDGLTTPDRVTELLSVMQKEKENVNESTRHWSNVVNTLATTENKECLDLFVQLDGLSFIDKWLKDALNDMENSDLEEELIIGFLRALERLELENDRSGIGKTVEGLFGHSSSVVREKAKALCDRWNPIPEVDGMESISVGVGNEENVEPETDKEEIPSLEMESVNPVDENPPESESELPGVSDSIPDSIPPVTDGGDPAESHLPEVADSIPAVSDSIPAETNLTGVSDSIPPVEGGDDAGGEQESDVSQMDKDIEDENEKQEIAGTVESTTLIPSNTDFDNELKTETSEKDEDMMERGESSNPKTTSNTESDEDGEYGKKDVGNESGNDDDDSGSDSSFSKKSTKGQDDDLVNKRPSDMELDYGIVDPLELARQVAIEIEREVDSDSGGQSSSSSSSQSMSGNGIEKEPEVSSGVVETTPVPEPEIPIPIPIPPVQEPESAPDVEKGFSGFDLNQDISSEETGTGIAFPASTPISFVSASRPEPATELPVSPLQFEGALGWKGSAATSAFRRIPEVEKTFSSSSSHRSDGLNFDLNVTESGDDKTENLFSRDKMPVTSYQETPRRFEKLELDLNSFGGGIGITDSSGVTLDWNRDSRVPSFQNYPPTQSLPFKNIDLNLNDHSNVQNNPFLSKLFNKRDDSVISLFGTQVEVNRKDSNSNSISISNSNSVSNSNSIPPPNGIDFTLGRPGSNSIPTPYSNLPNYTHNGYQMGTMYAPPGGSGGSGGVGGYGSMSYMVDSRGSMVAPQIMHPVYSQPYLYPPGSNGAGPSRNTFDLNSGFMGDLGNRENNGGLGLRQFLNTNQVRPIDEQQQQQYLRMNNNNNSLQQASSSSVIGGKRQEPESGWDLFPVHYKQQQHNHHYPHQQNPHQQNHQQPPWQ